MGEPVRQMVEAPIGMGLDQKTDPRKAPLGTLVAGENFVIAKGGRLDKRWGHTSMSKALLSGSMTEGFRLATSQSELCLFGGDRVYSYAPALTAWMNVDDVPLPVATVRPAYSEQDGVSTSAPNDVDVAYGNGLLVYTWRIGQNVFSLVVDEVTGALVMPRTQVNVGSSAIDSVQVSLASSTRIVCIYSDRVGGTIYGRSLDLTAPTAWGSEVTIAADFKTTATVACWDIAKTTDGRVTLAYTNNTGVATTSVTLIKLLATLATDVGPTQVNMTTDTIRALAVYSGTTLWVAVGETSAGGGDTYVQGFGPTSLASTVAIGTAWNSASGALSHAHLGLVEISATQVVVVGDSLTQGTTGRIRSRTYTTGAAFTSPVTRANPGVQLISRPFVYAGKAYALAFLESSIGGTHFLLDLVGESTDTNTTTFRPVATVEPRQCPATGLVRFGFANGHNGLAHIPSITSTRFITVGATGQQLVFAGVGLAPNSSRIRGMQFDMASTNRWMPAEMGHSLSISGGVPSTFDGRIVAEQAFLQFPNVTYVIGAGAAGIDLGAGAYQYKFCYAFRDAKGQTHRSAPSTAYSVTILANQVVAFTAIPCCTLTTRVDHENLFAPEISIEVYRTTVGLSSPFYYVGSVTNVVSSFSTTYTDDTIDLSLLTRRTIYTDGGELDNVCPPSASIAIAHKNRVWLAGCDDPKVVWFSKALLDGEGLGFHEDLTFRVDDGGAITALASMDDKLVVFKADRIFYLVGEGPNAAGDLSDLSSPQRLASDVGCIDARSVVLTPMGLMFQSRAGIYLLTRGMEVQYIGLDVEDALAANATITSAVLVAPQCHVRFTCNSSSTTGITLVFDYKSKAWLQHKMWNDTPTYDAQRVSACIWSNTYVSLGSNGRPYIESTTSCLDASTSYVPMSLEFAPLSSAGTQGYQSVSHVLANLDRSTAHTMTVSFAFDGESYSESYAYIDATLSALAREQLVVHPKRMKHQSLKVKLADSYASGTVGTGRGYSCASLAFSVVPKQGPQKNIAAGAKG